MFVPKSILNPEALLDFSFCPIVSPRAANIFSPTSPRRFSSFRWRGQPEHLGQKSLPRWRFLCRGAIKFKVHKLLVSQLSSRSLYFNLPVTVRGTTTRRNSPFFFGGFLRFFYFFFSWKGGREGIGLNFYLQIFSLTFDKNAKSILSVVKLSSRVVILLWISKSSW